MHSAIIKLRKHPLAFLVMLFFTSALFAQEKHFEPTILILTPNERIADKKTKKDIKEANTALREIPYPTELEIQQAIDEMKFEPENFQIMFKAYLKFSKKQDFYSSISSFIQRYLSYRFYEKFENHLIYESTKKSDGNLDTLSSLADQHKMRYILNLKSVDSWEDKSSKRTSIHFQLFDNEKKDIVLDKKYTGNDTNPGFEFGCREGSIDCTINNSLSKGLTEIIEIVANNNLTIIKERILAEERARILLEKYFSVQPEDQIISIINQEDSSIITKGFYQGFFNSQKDKFISFFIVSNEDVDTFKKLTEQKEGNVQIISDDIYDLENVPKLYSYVIVGIKKGPNWFLKKDKITYFNASDIETGRKIYFNNLQNWNFFKENSTEQNFLFWNSYFFSKVERAAVTKKDRIEDLLMKKEQADSDEYKEIFQDMIDDIYEEDLKNERYFGEYSLIASALKEQEREQNSLFENEISTTILEPFFESYISNSKSELTNYIKLNTKSFSMIYPTDKSTILVPIVLESKNGEKLLEYFVLINQEDGDYNFFKWTYFTPKKSEFSSVYGGSINEQLNTITTWNFSFDYLNDSNFWNNYVLSKTNDSFKYLKQIEF